MGQKSSGCHATIHPKTITHKSYQIDINRGKTEQISTSDLIYKEEGVGRRLESAVVVCRRLIYYIFFQLF